MIIYGASGVGKTCIMLRLANQLEVSSGGALMQGGKSIPNTIGVDFQIYTVSNENRDIKFRIWDTAGAEMFRTITISYMRGANIIILVYDVTDIRTFYSIENWIRLVRVHGEEDVPIVLIGNKCDKEEKREVTFEGGQKLCTDNNLKSFMEVSAKSAHNILELELELFKISLELNVIYKHTIKAAVKMETARDKMRRWSFCNLI
jgi:Ras-related protein Rab-8A